jgi:DNA processing protein
MLHCIRFTAQGTNNSVIQPKDLSELEYEIALSLVPQVGPTVIKQLLKEFGSAKDIFAAKQSVLQSAEGIGFVRASEIKKFTDFALATKELAFAQKHDIKVLSITSDEYPQKLKHCTDAPNILYYCGNANLNNTKIISIVGKRKCTDYGRRVVDDLLEQLTAHNILIVSGLAVGVDIHAHRKALQFNLPTVAVLAHGLDRIYPTTHRNTARQMVDNGGLLTEYMSGTNPDRENFPTRNRIVAGMSDVTIVIETDIKGGSMITAQLANGYNKDVMAYPGSVYSETSAGCNYLIKTNRANAITCAKDLLELMNWDDAPKQKQMQRALFIELNAQEQTIFDALQQHEFLSIDELTTQTKLSPSALAAATLSLEMQGVLQVMPGKSFKLL